MVKKQDKPYFQVSTLGKGLDVLDLLADKGSLSVSGAAKYLGINRASAHRFLATLQQWGYVRKDIDGLYGLSLKLFELGQKAVGRLEIVNVSRPYLQELSDLYHETVNLGHWENQEILHIDKINSPEILRMDQPIGGRAPVYCTALGKAILSALPESELERYLTNVKFKRFTKNTATSCESLVKELIKCRRQGYAIDNEELVRGLRCVASAVYDHNGFPSYAVSVSGPAIRITLEHVNIIQKEVRRVAGEISNALGVPMTEVRS